jgi:hypothetical protein
MFFIQSAPDSEGVCADREQISVSQGMGCNSSYDAVVCHVPVFVQKADLLPNKKNQANG